MLESGDLSGDRGDCGLAVGDVILRTNALAYINDNINPLLVLDPFAEYGILVVELGVNRIMYYGRSRVRDRLDPHLRKLQIEWWERL